MNNLLLIVAAFLLLQGCALTSTEQEPQGATNAAVVNTRGVSKDEQVYYYMARTPVEEGSSTSDGNLELNSNVANNSRYHSFSGERSVILSEVVSKMAEQLIANLPLKSRKQSIALTSIVDLKDHQITNWLGQTISEQFIHELHVRDIKIVDFKLTGNIQLTPEGEFALTRDWKKLNKNIDVRRILTGTMSNNDEGIMLNVRIVNIDTSIVESTSSAFIPGNMFIGGDYDYQDKRYISRNSKTTGDNIKLVHLVK